MHMGDGSRTNEVSHEPLPIEVPEKTTEKTDQVSEKTTEEQGKESDLSHKDEVKLRVKHTIQISRRQEDLWTR